MLALRAFSWAEREALCSAVDDGFARKQDCLRGSYVDREDHRLRAEAALDGLLSDPVACDILRRVLNER